MESEYTLNFCLHWAKYFMFVLGEHQILILARNCFQNKPPGIQPLLEIIPPLGHSIPPEWCIILPEGRGRRGRRQCPFNFHCPSGRGVSNAETSIRNIYRKSFGYLLFFTTGRFCKWLTKACLKYKDIVSSKF